MSNQLSFCQFPKFRNKTNVRDMSFLLGQVKEDDISPSAKTQSPCQEQRLVWGEVLSLDRAIFLFLASFYSCSMSQKHIAPIHSQAEDFYCSANCNRDEVYARIHIKKSSFFGGPSTFIPPLPPLLGYHHPNVVSPALSKLLFSVGHLTKWCPGWRWQITIVLNRIIPVKHGWLA